MIKNIPNNTKGEITSRELLITGAITIAIAIIIIIVFIIISGKKDKEPTDSTSDLIDQIKKQSQQKIDKEESIDKDTGEPLIQQKTFRATTEELKTGVIIVKEDDTGIIFEVSYDKNTDIQYNGISFDTSDFYIDDQLLITMQKEKNEWHAEKITLLLF